MFITEEGLPLYQGRLGENGWLQSISSLCVGLSCLQAQLCIKTYNYEDSVRKAFKPAWRLFKKVMHLQYLQEACQSKIGAYFKAQKISGTTCEDH
jgi:hypothetical protein